MSSYFPILIINIFVNCVVCLIKHTLLSCKNNWIKLILQIFLNYLHLLLRWFPYSENDPLQVKLLVNAVSLSNIHTFCELHSPFVFWSTGFRLHISISTDWEKGVGRGGDWVVRRQLEIGGKWQESIYNSARSKGAGKLKNWRRATHTYQVQMATDTFGFSHSANFFTNAHWAKCIFQPFITWFDIHT